jgi:hypothetical protein
LTRRPVRGGVVSLVPCPARKIAGVPGFMHESNLKKNVTFSFLMETFPEKCKKIFQRKKSKNKKFKN